MTEPSRALSNPSEPDGLDYSRLIDRHGTRATATPPTDNTPKGSHSEAFRAEVAQLDAEARRLAEQARVTTLWRRAGVPDRHAARVAELRAEASGPWRAAYDDLRARLGSGIIYALLGPRGTGKTQLAVMLIRDAVEAGRAARYVKALDLFRELRATYSERGSETEAEVVRRYVTADLLLLDELAECGRSEFEARTLTSIIDRRYDARRDTLLITNETRAAFAASIGPSVVSRIHECGGVIECVWPSFRVQR